MPFEQEQPPINIGADISVKSFEMIAEELKAYPKAKEFDHNETEVISRLIHTSTCFEQVLENIHFTKDAIPRMQELLQRKAKIIVDVNMIKVGVSLGSLKRFEGSGQISLESLLKLAFILECLGDFEKICEPKEIIPKSIEDLL